MILLLVNNSLTSVSILISNLENKIFGEKNAYITLIQFTN
jgi:hypothetical protein